MAVEAASLNASLQAGVQALKRTVESEAAVASLVTDAAQQGKSSSLPSPAPAEGSGTVVDIYA